MSTTNDAASESGSTTREYRSCVHCGEPIFKDDNGAGVVIWCHDFGSTVCHDFPLGSVADGPTAEPATLERFASIEAMKRANRDAGFHFFDADSMRFFRSRIAPGVIGGRFFVTSEQYVAVMSNEKGPRLYTVREMRSDGSIETVGEFQAHRSLGAARNAALRAAQS